MNLPRYQLKSGDKLTTFEFISEGPKGRIPKLIQISPTNVKDMYNLAFGDKDRRTGRINDTIISNNGDSEKVLATVVATYPVKIQIPEFDKSNIAKMKVHTNLFNRNTKITLNTEGKHFLEIVDTKKKRKRWLVFTGKSYKLPHEDFSKGRYTLFAFDKDMKAIGRAQIVMR